MKHLFILICGIFFLANCSENSVTPVNGKDPLFEINFVNNVTDLNGRWTPIEFVVKNNSSDKINIPGKVFKDNVFFSRVVKKLENDNWITFEKMTFDSLITILPNEFMKSSFSLSEKGKWQLLIPIINSDTLYSNEHIVINNIEDSIDVDIHQIPNTKLISFSLMNKTNRTVELRFGRYGYCHDSFLTYDLLINDKFKELKWDDNSSEWNLIGTEVWIVCMREVPSSVFINTGMSYRDTIFADLPSGRIRAKIDLPFSSNWENTEVVYHEFNNVKN